MSKKSNTAILVEETLITQADIDVGKLVLRKRVEGRIALPTKRVAVYLNAVLVERFKEMGGERGYQPLIHETLNCSFQQSDMEATIRKVFQEELKPQKAA